MKTKTLCIVVSLLMAMMILSDATAQLGMDYETNFGLTWYYSKLRRVNGTDQNRNRNNEKALGVYAEPGFLPQSALEINTNFTHMPNYLTLWYNRGNVFRTAAPTGFTQQWEMFRDNTPVARLFNTQGTENVTLEASLNGHLFFNTNSITRTRLNGTLTTTINGVNQNVSGYFGIGPNGYFAANSPKSMLHLEGTNNTPWQGNGWRKWMNTGAFMQENSDAIFVGMKQEGYNRSDAVINWSDDTGDDNLRVIFTGNASSGNGDCNNCPRNSLGLDGMEIARFTPSGRTGIGPDFTNTLPPRRRLDILTDFQNNPTAGEPQLRLTFEQNTSVANGRYTDFQTTANGDLAVFAFNSTLNPVGIRPRNVGLQTTTPRRRLDIFDDGAGTFFFGRPQLRLTQADNASVQIYTDFQTTSQGDLFITPAVFNVATNTLTPRNTGIQTFVPQNTLEINSRLANETSNDQTVPGSWSGSTGASGLRFSDLKSNSTVVPTGTGGVDPSKVLSVDANGDVVLINSTGGGGGFFHCNPGTATTADDMPFDSWWEMKNHNFIFYGNGGTGNNVKIGTLLPGFPSTLTCTPLAKLEVHQKSGFQGTAGIFVSNEDLPFTNLGQPSCGIFSYMPAANPPLPCGLEFFKVAGWFESHGPICYNPVLSQYAIYVPKNGGTVEIGFPYNANYPNSNLLLKVNSVAMIGGQAVGSDSKLKKDTIPMTSGLSVIRNIHPLSYRYNGKAGFDTVNTYFGVIAEDIAQIADYAVDTFYAKLDSSDATETTLLSVRNEAILYTTINAVKELDSMVTNMSTLLVPNTPILASPVNNATGLPLKSIELKWLKADHAASYFGEVSEDAAFNKIIRKFSSSDTSALVDVHDYSTSYYWRVAAVNMTGKSQYSQTFSFTTQPIPGTPVLITPPDYAVNVPLTSMYVWSNGIKVAYNVIEVSLDSIFKNLVAQYSVKDTSINITLKEYNTVHYWRVKATLFDNQIATSQTFRFISEMLPGTATLIAPANGAANVPLNATFLWSTGIKVHKHIIDVALDAGFKNMVAQYSIKDSTINITLKEYSMAHYWRVTTFVNANNSVGAVSQTWSFTTIGKAAAAMDTLTNVSYRSTSDSRYKTNIGTIADPLQKVMQLNGISYDWKVADFPDINFDSNRQLGFIAQEVEPIIPEVVRKDSNGYYSLDYDRFIPVLVEAIKQQQETIDSFKQQNFNLESMQQQISAIQICVENLPNGFGCNGSSKMANPDGYSGNNTELENQKIVLESFSLAILYQNEPNPFGNSTVIRYYVPENTKEAMLVFYDEFGREISKELIQQKGYSKVEINSEKLAAGIYTYSIVVDGKVADTKKMMRTKN